MIRKVFFLFLVGIVLSVVVAAAVMIVRPGPVLEYAANRSGKEFLAGRLSVGSVKFGTDLRLFASGIRGSLRTRQGPVEFEIGSVESLGPVYDAALGKPVRFMFKDVRPKGSPRVGISGVFSFLAAKKWRFELEADLGGADLEDFQWVDPGNLTGSAGATKGKLVFTQTAGEAALFNMDLEAPEPGGKLQAKFFDLFLPYLPVSVQKERVEKLAAEGQRIVRFQTAGLVVSMPQSDQMKVLLRILVLDYNLKLTLNATIRTDAKDTFSEVARLMGLIEVKL